MMANDDCKELNPFEKHVLTVILARGGILMTNETKITWALDILGDLCFSKNYDGNPEGLSSWREFYGHGDWDVPDIKDVKIHLWITTDTFYSELISNSMVQAHSYRDIHPDLFDKYLDRFEHREDREAREKADDERHREYKIEEAVDVSLTLAKVLTDRMNKGL